MYIALKSLCVLYSALCMMRNDTARTSIHTLMPALCIVWLRDFCLIAVQTSFSSKIFKKHGESPVPKLELATTLF